ncbi:MAG: hypothetical protein J6Y90_06090, partial [Lachnospiraceae bacterium]|nr:hypothetical protein [Lachnospiraceae bacterium]
SEADTDINLDGEKTVPCDGEKTVPCDGGKTVSCDGEKTAPFVPHEMAGVDVVIARELRIRPEDVVFEEYNGKADWTYVCLSENAKGVRTNAGAFKSRFSEIKDAGVAAVPRTTGYIQVFVNNDKVLDRSLKTEAEQAWELYMDEVLPAFAAYLENNVGGDGGYDGDGGDNNSDSTDNSNSTDNSGGTDNSGSTDNSNSTDDEDNKGDVDHKVNKNEDCEYNGERGSKASPSLRVDLAIGTSGLTVIEDDLSKSALEGLCEAMMAVGDKYLKALGFDFDGKTAAEAGVLNVTTVEYLGNPQLRVSV